MKKVLFILAFLAIGMIATAQTQTIYNQLKLATVNDGTVSDSLVLVQGTDKIIRKIPLSSISGSTEIPSLQEVTNNGNVTSHPIHAKEFRVDSNPDSLMVLNNRYFTLGDVGSDYNGNWRRYFSVFDPNDYPQGFEFYSQDAVNKGVLTVYGDVDRGNSNFNVYSGGNEGSASFNVNSYYNNSWFTTKGLELGSSGASSAYLRLDAANNELNIQSNNIRFRNSLISPYVELETSSVTSNRVLNAPDESGTIATREWVTANSGGGTPTLQEVLTAGNTSTIGQVFSGGSDSTLYNQFIGTAVKTDIYPGALVIRQAPTGTNYVTLRGASDGSSVAVQNTGGVASMSSGNNGGFTIDNGGFSSGRQYVSVKKDGIQYSVGGTLSPIVFPASLTYTGNNGWHLPDAQGTFGIVNTTAPASAKAAGKVGEIRVTSTYIYVCTATNTWVRAPLATW